MKKKETAQNTLSKQEEDVTVKFDNLLKKFKEKLNTIDSTDELKAIAKETESEADEYDKLLNEKKYVLPDKIDFEGKTYTKSTIKSNICYFLSRQSVKYEYALGMHQTYVFWKNDPTEIPYKTFDSLVRLLSTFQFQGDKEWTDILAINAFLGTCVKEYQKDLTEQLYYANKFNAIEERGKLLTVPANKDKTN